MDVYFFLFLPENSEAGKMISIGDVKPNDKDGVGAMFSSRLLVSGRGYGLARKHAGRYQLFRYDDVVLLPYHAAESSAHAQIHLELVM